MQVGECRSVQMMSIRVEVGVIMMCCSYRSVVHGVESIHCLIAAEKIVVEQIDIFRSFEKQWIIWHLQMIMKDMTQYSGSVCLCVGGCRWWAYMTITASPFTVQIDRIEV